MYSACLCFFRNCLLCLGVAWLTCGYCRAQQKAPRDSVKSAALNDTIRQRFDERVMRNLRDISQRKTIMGKLLKAVLIFDRNDEEIYGMDAELVERENERHNYKVVRRISILTLNAFGYSIHDTTRVPANFAEKAANALHVKTRQRLIRNRLLFRQNELLNPLALVESERLLRQASYLLDARIVVNEATSTTDSVDIFVVTKDVFSLGGSGSYSPPARGRVALRELNFLGLGHQLRADYRFGLERPEPQKKTEFTGQYTIENISNSYISADVLYADRNLYQDRSIYLRRDFYATNTKYAGAVGARWVQEQLLIPSAGGDTLPTYADLEYSRQEAWLGRTFKFKNYMLGYEPRSRAIAAVRVINTNYTTAPTDNFQSNILFLGSVGYSERRYYKDRFLFGFGRTEDVPAGTLLAFTYGFEKGTPRNRSYIGAELSSAKYGNRFGYLFGKIAFGSFVRGSAWQQGILDVQSFYFTRLYEHNNWKLRHYIIGRSTYGLNRTLEEQLLTINNESGLRGFRSDFLRGSKRIAINYEANLYTPLTLFGFKLALLGFADVAWLSSGNDQSPLKTRPYQGFGIGFRFRNEYLSFSTIQLLLGYYPVSPPLQDFNSIRIFEASRPYYDFADFRFTQPGVAGFQ